MIRRGREFWVTLIVVILVIAMILPLYNILNLAGNRDTGDDYGDVYSDPEDVMEQNKKWIASLENYLEENEPNLYILRELADAYATRSFYLDYSEEGLGYLEKAAAVLEQAIELEPQEPESYIRLYDVYSMMNLEEKAAEQAARAEDLLREQLEKDPDDNLNRYYLSMLLEEYHHDLATAREQLEIILSSEPEDSDLYVYARQRIVQIDGSPQGKSDDGNGGR
ncbi:MAG: hypothetical protein WAO23_06585 [Dethiobacteria bacterium]